MTYFNQCTVDFIHKPLMLLFQKHPLARPIIFTDEVPRKFGKARASLSKVIAITSSNSLYRHTYVRTDGRADRQTDTSHFPRSRATLWRELKKNDKIYLNNNKVPTWTFVLGAFNRLCITSFTVLPAISNMWIRTCSYVRLFPSSTSYRTCSPLSPSTPTYNTCKTKINDTFSYIFIASQTCGRFSQLHHNKQT